MKNSKVLKKLNLTNIFVHHLDLVPKRTAIHLEKYFHQVCLKKKKKKRF
jgi:hypothetical protein